MNVIKTDEELQRICEKMDDDVIAVDTEFVREVDIKPILCLLQIATSNDIFIIDPVLTNLSPLKTIFENKNIRKIFHDARQDIEILNLNGINVENSYDTQLAEMLFCVRESEGYRTLVFKYAGKKLPKNQTLSDWLKRPLSKKQLQYAMEDVQYLLEIYSKQLQKLHELGRYGWLNEVILPEKQEDTSMTRELLMGWREKKSEEIGVPVMKIAKTNLIHSIVRKGLCFVKQLQSSREMNKNEYTKEFLDFAATIVNDSERIETPMDIVYLLRSLLGVCARKNSICPAIIARKNDLEMLVRGKQNVACLSGWRFDIFGRYALQLLSGEISLKIQNNEVVIV